MKPSWRFPTRAPSVRICLVLVGGALFAGACGDVDADLITGHVQATQRCATNTSCPTASPVCDVATGSCGPCRSDGDCPATAARCNALTGACVECLPQTMTTDCTTGELILCDPAQGRCVECLADGHCTEPDEYCSTKLGLCALKCASTTNCPIGEVCDLSIGGFCVECVDDSDCGEDGPCRRSECVGR